MKRRFFKSISNAVTVLICLISTPSDAEIKLPRLISDGLILQRDKENLIWGWASPDEEVTISLDGKLLSKTNAKNGYWFTKLGPYPHGGPHKIEVSGSNTVAVNDIHFGDVWLASGQSNMQTPMSRLVDKFPLEIESDDYPLLRMFTVPGAYDLNFPAEDFPTGEWKSVNRETIESFSGVAYFFGKSLHTELQIPIGIINSSFGGSPAQAWMSEEALKEFPHYLESIKEFKNESQLTKIIEADKKASDSWYKHLNDTDIGNKVGKEWYKDGFDFTSWKTMEMPNRWIDNNLDVDNGIVWFKKEVSIPTAAENKPAVLKLGRIVDADTVYINGTKVGNTGYRYPPRRYQVPSNILKAGKNIITVRVTSNSNGVPGGFVKDKPYHLMVDGNTYDLKGLWHFKTGASVGPIANARFNQYMQPLGRYNSMLSPIFKTSIKGVTWYQGESNVKNASEYASLFPALIRNWRKDFMQGDFPFLYVQLANYLKTKPDTGESDWADTRFSQLNALQEPNTAMVVTIDAGEWNDIHPLDKKTVGERLALAAKAIAYHDEKVVYSGPLFDAVKRKNNELVLSFKHVGNGLTYRGPKLTGFSVKGRFGQFVWADARIRGDQVVLSNKNVDRPTHVRYAWADNPENANLYNKDGLPASPFEAAVETPDKQ